jgi:cobaltochelatase CobN
MARSIATTTVALLIAISVLLLPAAAEYPMFHNDPQRTGNVSGYAPVTANLIWCTDLGNGYIGGGASVVAGRVYVSNWPGSGTENLGLHCLNESDGNIVWSNVLGGDGGVSTPAIECGRVFAGAKSRGDLYCIDASDGATIWNRTIEPYPGYYGVASSPLIHNDVVYAVSSSDGRLHAFDFGGAEQWNYSASALGAETL